MVKWTPKNKNLRYTKNYNLFGQTSKNNRRVLSRLEFFFIGAFNCCVKYLNLKYQDKILKDLSLKVVFKRRWLNLGCI